LDGMHPQYEHSPPASSRSTMATRRPASASGRPRARRPARPRSPARRMCPPRGDPSSASRSLSSPVANGVPATRDVLQRRRRNAECRRRDHESSRPAQRVTGCRRQLMRQLLPFPCDPVDRPHCTAICRRPERGPQCGST
jgi:hypothetical protein